MLNILRATCGSGFHILLTFIISRQNLSSASTVFLNIDVSLPGPGLISAFIFGCSQEPSLTSIWFRSHEPIVAICWWCPDWLRFVSFGVKNVLSVSTNWRKVNWVCLEHLTVSLVLSGVGSLDDVVHAVAACWVFASGDWPWFSWGVSLKLLLFHIVLVRIRWTQNTVDCLIEIHWQLSIISWHFRLLQFQPSWTIRSSHHSSPWWHWCFT